MGKEDYLQKDNGLLKRRKEQATELLERREEEILSAQKGRTVGRCKIRNESPKRQIVGARIQNLPL